MFLDEWFSFRHFELQDNNPNIEIAYFLKSVDFEVLLWFVSSAIDFAKTLIY